MKFSFEIETDIPPQKIWALYDDVTKWFAWEKDLEEITLDGKFENETIGEMTLTGQPPMAFTLVSVVPNESFTNKAAIPHLGEIHFHHQLIRNNKDTIVKHAVELVPLNRMATVEDSAFASQVFSKVPASVFALIEAAK